MRPGPLRPGILRGKSGGILTGPYVDISKRSLDFGFDYGLTRASASDGNGDPAHSRFVYSELLIGLSAVGNGDCEHVDVSLYEQCSIHTVLRGLPGCHR